MLRCQPLGTVRLASALLLLAGLEPLCGSAFAQTSYPMLTSVYPAGLRRGATTEVAISGTGNFAGAYGVLFDGAGLAAEVVPQEPKPAAGAVVNTVTLRVAVATDTPLGTREFRVLTPRGASTIGLLVVGDEPESQEKEPNDSREQAASLTLPVTMNGRIQASEDVDQFKFQAEAGQEIVFSVISARLQDKIHDLSPGGGGTHSDLLLTLTDAAGLELAGNDDFYRADPMLAYRFERAGEYCISVRDVRYAGHATWSYRLTATRDPYLTAVYPLAGRRGENVAVEPVGYNLGGMARCSVPLPAAQAEGVTEVQLRRDDRRTNPLPFLVTDLPETLEQEPNDEPAAATRVGLPGGWNGRIGRPLDTDCFAFRAARGTRYTFEVHARRLGSALDSTIEVLESSGKPASQPTDDGMGKDSRLDWTAPADGDYVLQVTDLHGRGGDTFVYHVTAAPAKPDFTLQCDDDRALVGPGSGYAMFVRATRRNEFAGEIRLAVEGLPPGVTAVADRIPAEMTEACVIFRAAPDAAVQSAKIRVIGTAEISLPGGGKETIRRVADALQEIYLPGGGRGRYAVQLHTLSVTEPSDVVVKVATRSVTLSPGGSAGIDVEVVRQKGYSKPVILDLYLRHLGSIYGNPLPRGVSLDETKSKTLLGPNETRGRIVLKAADDAPPVENLPIAVLGQVSINFVVKVSHASEPLLLTVARK